MRIIDSEGTGMLSKIAELYRYRDLFITLSWRDFRVRYAQTAIGFFWAFIQPVATLVILSVVFGKISSFSLPVPHILFTITGLSIWTYFSYVMVNSGNSIIASQGMVKKIYFPRLIIPLSKAIVGLIDLSISLVILTILMFYFKVAPEKNFFLAPLFLIVSIFAALGVGIWLSALTVKYRDFQHVVPFMVQLGMYITPVAYPASYITKHLPNWAVFMYYLNPMTGIIQGFSWSLLGTDSPGAYFFISFTVVIVLFFSGLYYFNKIENDMADYV